MEPFKKFSLMDESKVVASYRTILNQPMEKLSEKEKIDFKSILDKLETEVINGQIMNWQILAEKIWIELCLKKNEEIERLTEDAKILSQLYQNLYNTQQKQFLELQAFEERIKELTQMLEKWQLFDSRIHTGFRIAELHLETQNLLTK